MKQINCLLDHLFAVSIVGMWQEQVRIEVSDDSGRSSPAVMPHDLCLEVSAKGHHTDMQKVNYQKLLLLLPFVHIYFFVYFSESVCYICIS